MAILQGIISLITRSAGKIFSALFDWAVVALFGRVEGRQKIWLSALMGAAALWPVLVLGAAIPRLAAFVIALVPLSSRAPSGILRAVWIALVILVPLVVGAMLRVQAQHGRPRASWPRSLARGFPITLALSAAFLVLLVTVPALRVASAVRGRVDVHVPLITTGDSYRVAAELVLATLRRHGVSIAPAEPPWWASAPVKILHRISGEALSAYVPAQTAYYRGDDLEVALYPSALLLRGTSAKTGRAHGLLVEALTGQPDMLQTTSAEAQDIERQLQRVWSVFRENPHAHRDAAPLISRLGDISAEIAGQALPFDEWQVVYRQTLQLARALGGEPQLIEQTLGERQAVPVPAPEPDGARVRHGLSTRRLLSAVLEQGARLVSKQVELARAEVKADVVAELSSAKMIAGAAIGFLVGLSVLLLALVAALVSWMPDWLAAAALSVLMLAIGGWAGYVGWTRRARAPLAATRRSVKEDMERMKTLVGTSTNGGSPGSGEHERPSDGAGPAYRAQPAGPSALGEPQRLSTRELLSRILHTGAQLVSKEIELARAELKADLKAQVAMAKMLAVAAVGGLVGLNLLLVTVVLALARVMPAWLAALGLGGVIIVISGIVGYIGWQRRVTRPLAETRKTVTEDLQWAKERLA